MEETLSKSRIDKLGERLKSGSPTEEDLILLDRFRLSFADAYESIFEIAHSSVIQKHQDSVPRGRSAKTKESIIAKLQRGSTKLGQMQDIVGCRIIVPTILDQNEIVDDLLSLLPPKTRIVDRRAKPSNGYRAVHLVPQISGKPVEVQVRTRHQHHWAANCERLAIKFQDPSIKYGGGSTMVKTFLERFSDHIAKIERSLLKLPCIDSMEAGDWVRTMNDLVEESKRLTEEYGPSGEDLLHIQES